MRSCISRLADHTECCEGETFQMYMETKNDGYAVTFYEPDCVTVNVIHWQKAFCRALAIANVVVIPPSICVTLV